MKSQWQEKLAGWRKLKKLMFEARGSGHPTEIFVNKVMARLPQTERPGFFAGVGFWLRAPIFAFSAMLIVFLGIQLKEPSFSIGEMLLAGEQDEDESAAMGTDEALSSDFVGLLEGDL